VANDTNLATDVFVRDMQTATTAMASVDSSGAQGPEASRYARLSSDGRYVVFDTASPLVANDTNEATDVFLHDFQSATTTRVSVESHGNQSASASSRPAIGDEISAAGTYTALAVVFQSAAADLTSGDGNGLDDVFLHDPAGVAPTSVVHCTTSTSTNACNASIAATGTPSLAAASGFTLTCTGIEGQKMCLYFYGTSGPTSLRWATGSTSFLCVQPPTQRTPPQSSAGTATTCNGALALDVLAFLSATPSALGHPLFVGERFDAQLWFRDPPAPKTTNLSNAITFWLTP
jgi:hypothetical protein